METHNVGDSSNASALSGTPILSMTKTMESAGADPSHHTPMSLLPSFIPTPDQMMPPLASTAPSKFDSVQGRMSPIAHLHHARAGAFKRPAQSSTKQITAPLRPPPPRPSTSSPPPPPPPPPPPEMVAASKRGFSTSQLGAIVQEVKREASATEAGLPDQSVLNIPGVEGAVVLLSSNGQFMKLVKSIATNERKLMKRRIAIVGRKNDLRAQLPFYHAAQEEFAQFWQAAMPDILKSNLSPNRKQQLSQAWIKTERLSSTVDRWQKSLEHEEDDELLKLEGKCLAKQEELMKLLADFYPHDATDCEAQRTNTVTDTTKLDEASPTPSVISQSSEDLNPMRLRYLEAIGDMNLLRDRMFNLQSDLRIQHRKRDQALNAGNTSERPGEDFYAELRSKRQDLINTYWMTKEKMNQAFEACLADGLDVMPAYFPTDTDLLFSIENDAFVASDRPDEPYHLSESSVNIARWSRHVAKMSLPQSAHLAPELEFMTYKEVEDLVLFPVYARQQVSTGKDEPSAPPSGSRSPRRPSGYTFTDDIPTASRRYSAPMILQSTEHDGHRLVLDYQPFKARKMNARRRQHMPISRRANTEI